MDVLIAGLDSEGKYCFEKYATLRYAARNTLLLRRSEIHPVGEIWGSESEPSISGAEGGFISIVFQ